MWHRYGFNIFAAFVFFFLLLPIKDISTSNEGAIILLAFSMYPLYYAGMIGANAVDGVFKVSLELLNRYLSPQYLIKFQNMKAPAFIYDAMKVCIHCFFASIMASTYLYNYMVFALFSDDEAVLTSDATSIFLIFYIVLFTMRFSIMQIMAYLKRRMVNKLNAKLSQ